MGCETSHGTADSNIPLAQPQLFFLLGGPGSGKGTQAANLTRDYRFKHLSSGDLLREEIERGGKEAQMIAATIKEGKLLPSSLVVSLIKKSITMYGNRRYLLDGFPRNHQNWDQLQRQFKDQMVVRNLIFIECPIEVLMHRMEQRGKSSGRADDNTESALKRIETFKGETLSVVEAFEKRGNCIRVNGNATVAAVYEELQSKLSIAHVYPPNPAQVLFVLGGPGSGKGTQCQNLIKQYKELVHLSTGDLLRVEIKKGTKLGVELDKTIKQGKLVSSELMVKLIAEEMEVRNFSGKYLLDGFPRGQENIDVWERDMKKWTNIRAVLYFECQQAQLKRRLLERGKTSGRSDDNQQSVLKRLKVFNEQTKPILQHYGGLGKLHRFDGNMDIHNVYHQVTNYLGTLGIYPPYKPVPSNTTVQQVHVSDPTPASNHSMAANVPPVSNHSVPPPVSNHSVPPPVSNHVVASNPEPSSNHIQASNHGTAEKIDPAPL